MCVDTSAALFIKQTKHYLMSPEKHEILFSSKTRRQSCVLPFCAICFDARDDEFSFVHSAHKCESAN